MAKLALVFIAVFLFVQFAIAEPRVKRDTETTTQNILDSIKSGIENTLSEQNIKKAVEDFNDFGEKLMGLGSKVVSNMQNAFKSDTTTPAP